MLPRIAAPFASCCRWLSGQCAQMPRGGPANDNGPAGLDDPLLRAALRHFGAFGLHAAWDAGRRAEAAYLNGERDAFRHWLEIGSLLGDRPAFQRTPQPKPTLSP